MFKVFDSVEMKLVNSPDYNSAFNKKNGFFARWGKTQEDDPVYAPAPEILDLEISYGGKCMGNCKFCYKENGGDQPVKNMTFDEFKTIIDKMPPLLTQIAFGIMNISTNPDFFKMMEYCREKGIIPNFTCHGFDVTPEVAKKTADLCGAVAVSVYDKEKSYDAIRMFLDAGMKQVNIHFMLCEETYDRAFEIAEDIATDPRLNGFNALVFLAYKPKGRNAGAFHTIKDVERYKKLIDFCESKKVNYGFDSCSAPVFFKTFEPTDRYKEMAILGEACESTLFSSYINADGKFFPCSFNEGEPGWEEGLDVLSCSDFRNDIWFHKKTTEFRNKLIGTTNGCSGCPSKSFCRTCPTFNMTSCVGK